MGTRREVGGNAVNDTQPSVLRTVKVCVTRPIPSPSLTISRPRWSVDPDNWAADQTGRAGDSAQHSRGIHETCSTNRSRDEWV